MFGIMKTTPKTMGMKVLSVLVSCILTLLLKFRKTLLFHQLWRLCRIFFVNLRGVIDDNFSLLRNDKQQLSNQILQLNTQVSSLREVVQEQENTIMAQQFQNQQLVSEKKALAQQILNLQLALVAERDQFAANMSMLKEQHAEDEKIKLQLKAEVSEKNLLIQRKQRDVSSLEEKIRVWIGKKNFILKFLVWNTKMKWLLSWIMLLLHLCGLCLSLLTWDCSGSVCPLVCPLAGISSSLLAMCFFCYSVSRMLENMCLRTVFESCVAAVHLINKVLENIFTIMSIEGPAAFFVWYAHISIFFGMISCWCRAFRFGWLSANFEKTLVWMWEKKYERSLVREVGEEFEEEYLGEEFEEEDLGKEV